MNPEDLQRPVCRRCFERGHLANDCKEDGENFELIGPIAAFIGARLQYPAPDVNGQGNPWVSTIHVSQHKEKFWYVRVYCELASEKLVKHKWYWLRDRQRRLDAGEQIYCHQHKSLTELLQASGNEPSPEFFARCALHDAIHYRKTYMDAVRLRPHLYERICHQADHWILLHKTVEEIGEIDPSWLDNYLERFHVKDKEGLMEFFRKVYGPSFKDTMELHD